MKLPNPIVDFLRLEPLYFVMNLLCFWLKLKWRKNGDRSKGPYKEF